MSDQAHGKHRTNCACAKQRIDTVTTRAQILTLLLWCFLRHGFQNGKIDMEMKPEWGILFSFLSWIVKGKLAFFCVIFVLCHRRRSRGGGGWGSDSPPNKNLGGVGAEKHFYGYIWHFLWHRRPFFLAPTTSYTPGRLQNTLDHNSAVESAIHSQNNQRQKCRFSYLLLLLFLIYFVR